TPTARAAPAARRGWRRSCPRRARAAPPARRPTSTATATRPTRSSKYTPRAAGAGRPWDRPPASRRGRGRSAPASPPGAPGTGAADQGQDLNGDGDTADAVLQLVTYDLGAHTATLLNSGAAVRPCRLEACDPRFPYRVFDHSVKFLTFERDQGFRDLNGNGVEVDVVLQIFDICTGVVTPVAAIDLTAGGVGDPLSDPLQHGQTGSQVTVAQAGRCVSGTQ